MKTVKLLTLAFSSILLLASCGGGSSNEGDNSDSGASGGSGTSTIVKIMFHVDSSSVEGVAYKKRVDAFNAEYASQKIRAVPTFKARSAGGTDYEAQLIALQQDDNLPDVITFDAPNCAAYASSRLLYDITSEFSDSEQEDFLSLNKYQDKIYGLPIQESSAGFFYNKNIFRNLGIYDTVQNYTVDNPWTFDQFKSVCSSLLSGGVTPVDMRLDATKDETATYLLYPLIYAAGGEFVSSDGFTATGYYNSDKSKAGFQFIKDLVDANFTGYSIGATDFFTGKVGMYLSSGWTIPDLDKKYPEQFPDRDAWGLLPYPASETRASATGSWSYAVTNNGVKDKSAAVKLIKWMASAESSTVVTDATGMIPARKSCNPDYKDGSPEKVLLKQLEQTGRERPVTVCYPEFTTTFSDIIYKLRSNDVSSVVEAATKELQNALNEKQ